LPPSRTTVWAVFVSTGDALRRSISPRKGTGGFSTMATRETGTVKWFSNQKGYGFIARQSGDDVFVHFSSIVADGYRSLNEGDKVEFTVTQGPKGLAATEVRKI
jgi:CspA family cold shock protein